MEDETMIRANFKKELHELLDKHCAFLASEYEFNEYGDIMPYIMAYINHTDGKYQSSIGIDLGRVFE